MATRVFVTRRWLWWREWRGATATGEVAHRCRHALSAITRDHVILGRNRNPEVRGLGALDQGEAFVDNCTLPKEMVAPAARVDRQGAWWAQAAEEWERTHAKGRRSRWLPSGFDPFSTCPGVGPTGGRCLDPWCSEPGVYASGHDRRRAVDSPSGRDAGPVEALRVAS